MSSSLSWFLVLLSLTAWLSRVFAISGTSVTGTLPPDLSALTALQALDTSYNLGITGTIPSGIGVLTALVNLSMSANALTGTLPTLWSNLAQLHDVRLFGNALTGAVPSQLVNGPISYLDLSYNNLSGSVPNSFQYSARCVSEREAGVHLSLRVPKQPCSVYGCCRDCKFAPTLSCWAVVTDVRIAFPCA